MTITLTSMLLLLAGGAPDPDDADRRASLRTFSRTHTELSVGYLGNWSDERNRGFTLKTSAGPAEVAGAITDPFLGAPYVGALQAGPTVELRCVFDQVRFIAGMRVPFTAFRPSDTLTRVTLNGAEHDVLVRSVTFWEFRTGLGFELPFRRVTPFVDVLGDVSTLTSQLAIDGHAATYASTGFGLGARLGARIQLSHLFVQLAAEATAIGPTRLGASLQAGVAF